MHRKETRLRTAFISHWLQNSTYIYIYIYMYISPCIYNMSGNSQGDLANMAVHHCTRHFNGGGSAL